MQPREIRRFKVERERTKLHKLVEQYGLTDERVIKQSQQLDKFLNQYQHLQKTV